MGPFINGLWLKLLYAGFETCFGRGPLGPGTFETRCCAILVYDLRLTVCKPMGSPPRVDVLVTALQVYRPCVGYSAAAAAGCQNGLKWVAMLGTWQHVNPRVLLHGSRAVLPAGYRHGSRAVLPAGYQRRRAVPGCPCHHSHRLLVPELNYLNVTE